MDTRTILQNSVLCVLDNAGGNVQLVEGLLKDVPICYNAVVQDITYDANGVTVTTQDCSIQGNFPAVGVANANDINARVIKIPC